MGRSSEKNYRVYKLAPDGHITLGEWIEAADDAEAIQVARSMVSDQQVELWDGPRCIDVFSPADKTAGQTSESVVESHASKALD